MPLGQLPEGIKSAPTASGISATTAPATDNYASQVADTMQGLGVQDWGGTGTQYAEDVLNMETAGRSNVGTIQLPAGVGAGDFATLLTYGEQFAASAGWQYAPTAQQYDQMMKQGLFRADQSTVFQWLARTNGVSGSMPWAAAGMTHTQYNRALESIADTVGEYTGDRSMYSSLQAQAIANNWSSQHMIQELTTNPAYAAKSPWLKFGMTYQSFKDYKRQNKAIAQQQYGPNASDQQYADIYATNAPSKPQSGSAISLPTAQGGLVKTGQGSSVR